MIFCHALFLNGSLQSLCIFAALVCLEWEANGTKTPFGICDASQEKRAIPSSAIADSKAAVKMASLLSSIRADISDSGSDALSPLYGSTNKLRFLRLRRQGFDMTTVRQPIDYFPFAAFLSAFFFALLSSTPFRTAS